VDLLDWLIGPVESVIAYTGTLARDIAVEHAGVAALEWRNGAMGSINVTMLACAKNLERSITVLGKKGAVKSGGVAVIEIQHWESSGSDAVDANLESVVMRQLPSTVMVTRSACDNVVKTLNGEAEPEADGREGLRSPELPIVMYQSARDGRRMCLPLEF
jgi:UDP-N-acetyl-2-amino-2-deoxyglucuronate dehydrogenase